MFISAGEEQISLPWEIGEGPLDSFSPLELDPDSIEGLPMACETPKSPSVPRTCTYVNEVTEEEKTQLEQKILDLEGEMNSLRLKQRSLDEKRRDALNKILDIKGCIQVFCRVRPFSSTDRRRILQPLLVEPEKVAIRSAGSRKEFGFDKIFPQEASQEDVFVEVEPVLRSALDGHNVCILAYGQTGTGKTFTMDGTNDRPGVVNRAIEQLFFQASQDNSNSFTFSISMLEVYLGNLRDLLAPKLSSRRYAMSKCNLNVQTDSKGSVEIEGLTEVQISNCTKAAWWYLKGRRARSTSWTNVNEASSRSHCLTRVTIYRVGNALGSRTEVSKLWMVDLGGSERLLKTGASGQTLDEGRAINLSLSALGDVIASLRRKKGHHVPYRNSKLTQILRDSLGDGSKVLILVHISPYEDDVGETTCSFTFAKRARSVDTNRELRKELKRQKEKKIFGLEEAIKETVEECRKVSNQIERAEFLLAENKNLLSATYQLSEGEEKTPVSPKENTREIPETPQTSDKVVRKNGTNFAPRFMNPTVASRQRKNAAEKEMYGRVNSVRPGTRISVQISGCQSLSYSDPRFKAFLRSSNKKSPNGMSNASPMDDANCNNDAKRRAIQPRKVVASSHPNFRDTLGRHRRRMSDLI